MMTGGQKQAVATGRFVAVRLSLLAGVETSTVD
jgi:ABC-type polar amino acid transport system ATPase subunit